MKNNVDNQTKSSNGRKTVLEVKDLRVSFRTTEGVVKAVRGVSYELKQGETLAIVGESGSGKSVSSRAVMGILAGNAMLDGGEIIYEGQDLLKLHEDEFHKIRGNQVGMIFQDPTSSLNPILRIGQQISEGMRINGKRRKNRYESLFHKSYQAHRNAKYEYHDIKTNYEFKKKRKATLSRYRLEIKQIKANRNITKEQKDELIQNNLIVIENTKHSKPVLTKAERKVKLHEIKKQLKELKQPLKANKKAAKETVKAEYRVHKEDYLKQVEEIKHKIVKDSNKLNKIKFFFAKTFLPVIKLFFPYSSFKGEYQQLSDAYETYLRKIRVTHLEAREETIKIMTEVGIPEPEKRIKMYPFQFSGGMKQRIVIAIALTANPRVLICDEPTTALDVTIQAQILELLKRLKRERDLSLIFITHNLGVVANVADRVAVMYAGKIVEYGEVDELFFDPRHPYTWALLSSMPDLNSDTRLITIPGTPPNMLYPPKGDAFAQRNKYALKIDFEEMPPMFKVTDTHYAATWLLHENAPKVLPPETIKERNIAIQKTMEKMKKANELKENQQTNTN